MKLSEEDIAATRKKFPLADLSWGFTVILLILAIALFVFGFFIV